ncbi:MAG TPA: LysR substrate-binding domain-containing protein, partial [Candidatus Competibacteraceae bacterium]|nr:LysR substrate-binding domain-containing protein [Candidatus Competibacteraceae bacterium]
MYQGIEHDLLRTFVAIADQGGFTRAAEAVNRTQSAVSMQMKRLEEDIVQRPLFERDGRGVRLTGEGELLLGYARRILRLHDEALGVLRQPDMVGTVRIGIPDDYVMPFLPNILTRFTRAYPLVQVEVLCQPSEQLLRGDQQLDLFIATFRPGQERGVLLRREPTVWATAENGCAQVRDPLPLALFMEGCFFREWALRALEAEGRAYRIAYTSPSITTLLAAVSAGLAVS